MEPPGEIAIFLSAESVIDSSKETEKCGRDKPAGDGAARETQLRDALQ